MAMTIEDKIEKYLFNSDKNIFLTGQAGTGKTTLIKRFVEENPNTIIAAPTGVAAVNAGGDTMHKVFSIPVPAYGASISRVTPSKIKPLMMADNVIIDEISMARNDVFSYAVRVLRKAERLKGKKIRLIVVGDFSQLPPVIRNDELKYFKQFGYDKSGFPFTTSEWRTLNFKVLELEEVKRQEDREFIDELNLARIGDKDCIPYFNQFVKNDEDLPDDAIYVCGTNAEANRINQNYLNSLPGMPTAYQAIKEGNTRNAEIDEIVLLKEGARVMFTVNDVRSKKYQNGSFGTVVSLNEKYVTVNVNGEDLDIYPYKTSLYTYQVANSSLIKKEIGSVTQMPLKLAKAITIHKSQGKTFDKAILSPQIFAPGQLYVALSRVRGPEGLFLKEPIMPEYLKTNKVVNEFCENGFAYIGDVVKKKSTKTSSKSSNKSGTKSTKTVKSTTTLKKKTKSTKQSPKKETKKTISKPKNTTTKSNNKTTKKTTVKKTTAAKATAKNNNSKSKVSKTKEKAAKTNSNTKKKTTNKTTKKK